MRKGTATLVVGLWLAWSAPAAAEVMVGLTTGVVVPGQQDLVFKEYPSDNLVKPNDVTESLGPVVGATITAWGDWPVLRYFAVQFDPMYWSMSAKGANSPPAPHFTVHQQRAAFYLSALGRLPLWPLLGRFSEEPGKNTFAYLGAGIGAVHSSVTHGASAWGTGYQLLGGVSIPLTGHLRLRLEARYLLAPDVDTTPRDGPGWRVDTSGTHARFTVNRHLDTRFAPVLLGVDWRF